MKLLFVDTETTGLSAYKNGLVQIAGIVEIDGKVKEEFNFECRPFEKDEVDAKALTIIGKTREELENLPSPKKTYQKVVTLFDKYIDKFNRSDKFYLVGQNIKFDHGFLQAWFKKNDDKYFGSYAWNYMVDLIAIATLFRVAGKFKTDDMKLETMAKEFDISLDAHDALNDIRATREIFYRFVEQVKHEKVREEVAG